MTMKGQIYLLGILLVMASCSGKDEAGIIQINYGTSFGECLGYCQFDMKLEPGLVTYSRSGWMDSVVTITCSEALEDASWNSIMTVLETDAFFALPDRIGCPDCADGGAEWIEIETANGEKHKVIFEYHNEPAALEEYAAGLRDLKDRSEHCGAF